MCPFGAPHGLRPSHCAWTPNGLQTRMRRTQVAPKALRRCADDPRRGWGLLGADSRGVGLGRLGTQPNGASDHPRPAGRFRTPPDPTNWSVGTVKPVSEAPDSPPDLLSWRANPPTCESGAPPSRPAPTWPKLVEITDPHLRPRSSRGSRRCAGPLRADPAWARRLSGKQGRSCPCNGPRPLAPRNGLPPHVPMPSLGPDGQLQGRGRVGQAHERASNMAGAATRQVQPVGAQRSITARTRRERTGNHPGRGSGVGGRVRKQLAPGSAKKV
jgi:hypothetical protein